MKTLTVSVLLFLVAAPLWAEDDGGAPPPQPVENQVPADFQTGLFDMSGNRVADSMEQYQAQQQAQREAFQASHPDPGDGSGFRDVHGNYLGANFREAAEAGLLPGVDPKVPYDVEGAKALAERHGADKVNIDPQTGDAFTYSDSRGNVVTKEEFFADQQRLIKEQNDSLRQLIGQGQGKDQQTDAAISMSVEALEKSERESKEALEREKAQAEKIVPLRTLRSLEAGRQGGEQK